MTMMRTGRQAETRKRGDRERKGERERQTAPFWRVRLLKMQLPKCKNAKIARHLACLLSTSYLHPSPLTYHINFNLAEGRRDKKQLNKQLKAATGCGITTTNSCADAKV